MYMERGSGLVTGGKWINLHTSDGCNLRCSYCYFRNKVKREPTYDLEHVVELIEKVRGTATICFFGGEPTLNIPFMQAVMEAVDTPRCTFAIQTNGMLLDRVPQEMIERFVSIGVSIDGVEEVTDVVRGAGTFRKVTTNVRNVSEIAKAPIMARMTITEKNDLARDVDVLMDHFDAIYWQLDNDLGTRPHGDFEERYIAALPTIVDAWERRAREGRLINVVPLFGLYWKLTEPPPPQIYYHCSPGGAALTIDAAGRIYTCPEGVFRGREEIGGADIIGNISDLGEVVPVHVHPPKPECTECDIHAVCAGRCIWTHTSPYCACTKALVETVKKSAGRLWEYMDRKTLRRMLDTVLTTEIIP